MEDDEYCTVDFDAFQRAVLYLFVDGGPGKFFGPIGGQFLVRLHRDELCDVYKHFAKLVFWFTFVNIIISLMVNVGGSYGLGKVFYTIEEGGQFFKFPQSLYIDMMLGMCDFHKIRTVGGAIDTYSMSEEKETLFSFADGLAKSVTFVSEDEKVCLRFDLDIDKNLRFFIREKFYDYKNAPELYPSFFLPLIGVADMPVVHEYEIRHLQFNGGNMEEIADFTDGLICMGRQNGDKYIICDANGFHRLGVADYVLKIDTGHIMCVTSSAFERHCDVYSKIP